MVAGEAGRPTVPAPSVQASSALEEALGRIGDRWTLLVVSSLLDGPRRFGQLAQSIPGLAPNILSARLKHLERAGLVVTMPYCRRPLRLVYQLSATGSELAGVLRLLAQWGAGSSPGAEAVRHRACGTPMEARWYCPTCARPVDPAGAEDDDLYYL
ncbi:MAG: transcriptional regulator [Acidimicrobiales bacterium]|nr:MAG: transcriptional regulator [Acidimicrobiales bacterium]